QMLLLTESPSLPRGQAPLLSRAPKRPPVPHCSTRGHLTPPFPNEANSARWSMHRSLNPHFPQLLNSSLSHNAQTRSLGRKILTAPCQTNPIQPQPPLPPSLTLE